MKYYYTRTGLLGYAEDNVGHPITSYPVLDTAGDVWTNDHTCILVVGGEGYVSEDGRPATEKEIRLYKTLNKLNKL